MLALLSLGLIFGAVVVAAQPAPSTAVRGASSTQVSPSATSVPQVAGNPYPEIVAYVDGHPISRAALVQQIFIIQGQPAPADLAAAGDVVHVAVQRLIQDRILIDHAKDYGISVSDDDARALAKQQKAQFLQTDEGKRAIAPLAKQLGVSVEDYFDQPQVIQAYRESLVLGQMQKYVWNQVPANQRDSANEWQQAAITKFVAKIKANVRIMIPGY